MFASLLLVLLGTVTASGGEARLLCFGATWCRPCQEMRPDLEKLVADGFPVTKIDVDQRPDLARRFQVNSVPSCILIDARGNIIDRIDRATSYATLSRMLAHYGVTAHPATVRGQTPIAVPDHKVASRSRAAAVNEPRFEPSSLSATAQSQPAQSSPAPLTNVGSSRTFEDPASKAKQSAMAPTEEAVATTIRIRVEDDKGFSFGTGTVIDVHGQEALVLTCGHIFRSSDGKGRILMDRFDSPTAEPTVGSLINFDMDLDVALVSMKLTRPIKVAKLAPLTYKADRGEPVFSVGCSRGEQPTIMHGQINQIDRYLGPPNITASGRPVDGRSGGGLFNSAGELIGVCSAADPELDEGLYGALPRVYYELDRNGLSFVYDETSTETPIASVATTSRDLTGLVDRQPNERNETKQDSASKSATSEELVCVLRDRKTPNNESKVFVIQNPSRTLIEYLSREAGKGE